MKKRLVFILLIAMAFFYRQEISDHYLRFFSSPADSADWMEMQTRKLDQELATADYGLSIQLLQDFSGKIEQALQSLDSDKKHHKNRVFMTCKLASVYKKIALYYLQPGKEELYMQYIQKSQEELGKCADLRLTLKQL